MSTIAAALTVILVCLIPVQMTTTSAEKGRTSVEVWCGGDDNLTQGVCRNVYDEFASTTDFVLTEEGHTGALIVNIPTNVRWKQHGKRIRIFYVVEFLSNNEKKLRKKRGECWEDDLKTCASQVLRQARLAVRKIKS